MADATDFADTVMLGMRSVQLELLDRDSKIQCRATGFLLAEADGLFLYTCWHVVTGYNFFQPQFREPVPKRETIRVHFKQVRQPLPHLQTIGGRETIDIQLYSDGRPTWRQERNTREQLDLESLGLSLPAFADMVRIPCDLKEPTRIAFSQADISEVFPAAGTDVVILGYPYGYSAMEAHSPEPIFMKRSIASNMTSHIGRVYLDGGAAPGMSGAPIIICHSGRWWLVGMYSGVIFPDHLHGPERNENDRLAALGVMVSIRIGRSALDVPGRHLGESGA